MKSPKKRKLASVSAHFPLPGLKSLAAMLADVEIAHEEDARRTAKARKPSRPRLVVSKLLRNLKERIDELERRMAAIERRGRP